MARSRKPGSSPEKKEQVGKDAKFFSFLNGRGITVCMSLPGSFIYRKGKAPRNAEAIRGFSGTDGFGAFGTAVVSHIDTESGNGTVVNGSNGIF